MLPSPSSPDRAARWLHLLALGASLLLLAGCASLNSLASDVNSYSHWPAGRQPSSYVFERLPSQQANPEQQDALEAAARDALAQAGFSEAADAAGADVSVQVSARVTRQDYGGFYDDPFAWRGSLWYGRGFGHWWGPGFGLSYPSPRYEREVSMLIRDRKSGDVLYETRASNDGLSSGDSETLAAMFAAALKDFPQTAVNPRRVTIPLATR